LNCSPPGALEDSTASRASKHVRNPHSPSQPATGPHHDTLNTIRPRSVSPSPAGIVA
jgi:hypothetical protein